MIAVTLSALAGAVLAAPAVAGDTPSVKQPTTGKNVSPAAVPLPAVTGPIPTSSGNVPFEADGFSPEFPLPRGYTVKEYFVSGAANIYEFTSTGVSVVSPCPASVTGTVQSSCSKLPYTTRMLVYSPKDRRRFSGNVWVNPMNPTINQDFPLVWDRASTPGDRANNYFARNGDVFVQWTGKSVAVDALKKINPQRYSDLRWPYNPATPGDNSAPYDGITYDIAAQIGALAKSKTSASPFNRFAVKHVYETGFSQDGSFTFNQANVFHSILRLRGNKEIYDGYVPQGFVGQGDINMGLTTAGGVPSSDPRYKMGPRSAPVIKMNTETEIAGFGPYNWSVDWRRADSDSRNDRYREWEVGGSTHDDLASLISPGTLQQTGQVAYTYTCDHSGSPYQAPTPYPYRYVANAAYTAMEKWVAKGVKPAHVTPLAQTNLTSPSKETIERDAFGNPLGGVRTPYLTVPVATYNVIDSPESAGCFYTGWAEPFSQEKLHDFYPTKAAYVAAFSKAAAAAVRAGVWLRADAREAVANAKLVPIP